MPRSLFAGVDVGPDSTRILVLDADGHTALRTYLPHGEARESSARLAALLDALDRAHRRAPLVLCADGRLDLVHGIVDGACDKLDGPLQVVRRDRRAALVEVVPWEPGGPYRDALTLALLAALGRDDGDDR